MSKNVTVKQDEEKPIPVEILAESIVRVAEGFKRALTAGLTTECIVLLVHDRCGIGKPAIRRVLASLPELATYTTKGNIRP